MDEKHLNNQVAPRGSRTSMYATSWNDRVAISDEHIIEQHFLIEELGIPFLKVSNQLHTLKWNRAFLELTNTLESELNEFSIEDLGSRNPLFLRTLSLIHESLLSQNKVEQDYENGDVLCRIRVIPFQADGIVYVIYEDKSLQKQFQSLLTFHHQMEAVSHIAAGVAHELRNPLSVIKGFIQLADLTNDYNKYYETILSELDRMNLIIEDFLSVSRKKIERKYQSPVDIMQSLVEIMKSECLLHGVRLQYDFTDTSKKVHVNESMIKQVMLNLLRNSIEAFEKSDSEKNLQIETKVENNMFVIHVKDNGQGMPEEILSKLGRPFFTTKPSGTGIGIPLCKKIIEDHGGDFKVDSTYNIGTTVTLGLPLQ